MIKNSLKNVEMADKVEQSGNGLSVLICSAYKNHFNWMAYANWYSIYKNLPEAKVAVTVGRAPKIEHYYYHWVYKADVRYNLHKNVGDKLGVPYLNKLYGTYIALKEGLVKQPLLVLDADMMAISDLSAATVGKMNQVGFATNPCPYSLPFEGKPVGPVWYFNGQPLEKVAEVINTIKTLKGREHLDLLALSKVFKDEVTIIEDLGGEVDDHDLTTFTHYGSGCGNFTKKDWEKGKTVPPFNVAYALHTVDVTVNEKKVLALWSQMATFWDLANQVKM